MDQSSEYTFPIFISSTDYNLKDLRAELARFLQELGYRPILSSAEGFPDNSPNLEPWESCIPVLEQAFVMILVIDGKYGSRLGWPNSHDCLKEQKIAPTHGEYVYAHNTRKRMLVFIREEVMIYYQSYRNTLKNCGKDLEKTKEILLQTLPEYIDFDVLQFIHQVKTTRPIPWIKEFKDITDIKKEVQKKMLNELAEMFLIKNAHLDTVIRSFNTAMEALSIDAQKEVLSRIDATKQLISTVDEIAGFQKELKEKTTALDQTENENQEQRKRFEKEIRELKTKIMKLEEKSQASSKDDYFVKNGTVQVGNPNYIPSGSTYSMITGNAIQDSLTGFSNAFYLRTTPKCDRCHVFQTQAITGLASQSLHQCPSCKRSLCRSCWPKNTLAGFGSYLGTSPSYSLAGIIETKSKEEICPECARKN